MRRLKKGTPGKGAKSVRDSFSTVPVGSGLKNVWTGWIAGEPYWALAHEHKPPAVIGTKPCLTWLTDSAIPCPRCRPKECPTWIGWVPIYREVDHEPCIVIVHESAMDLLAGLTYATRVMVGRTDDTSSVYVRRAEEQRPVFASTHEQRQGPRDITPDLLQMWGIPALDHWMGCSDNALSLDLSDAPAALEAKPFTADPPALHRSNDVPMAGGAVDGSLNRVLKHVKDVESRKNGKH